MNNSLTEKVAGGATAASGALSFLGGWQVCHNICLGLIAVLALMGISVNGMPLEFLADYAAPLWTIAAALLLFTGYMYVKHKCVSKNMLAANAGLIIAATPFSQADPYRIGLWSIGFGLVGVAVYNYAKEKLSKKMEEKKCCHTQTQR
ncbi:MAG: hypothetical protein NUV67_01755 [archaeon]|nr:hypothetical protein [archaeon]